MEFKFDCGNTIVIDRYTALQTTAKALNYEGLPEHIDNLVGDTPEAWAQDYHNRFCLECGHG